MVLQDLGRRINAAVNDLTRSSTLDEKVCLPVSISYISTNALYAGIRRYVERNLLRPSIRRRQRPPRPKPTQIHQTQRQLLLPPLSRQQETPHPKSRLRRASCARQPACGPLQAQKGTSQCDYVCRFTRCRKDDDVYQISETLSDARIQDCACLRGYVPCGCF